MYDFSPHITDATVKSIDRWLLMLMAVWFIPKGVLFFVTAFLSLVLTPKDKRTKLGAAYRAMFFLLAPFSCLLGGLFYIRWHANRPIVVDGSLIAAISLRGFVFALMLAITITECWIVYELVQRIRGQAFGDLDQYVEPAPGAEAVRE